MKTVFISRDLTEDSIFVKNLQSYGVKITGFSLLEFSTVPFETIPLADWYFFYSQNGVKFFFDGCHQLPTYPDFSNIRFATIGESTAKALLNKGFQVDFIGSGEPFSTATAFLKVATDDTVLFIQAKKSRQSVEKILIDKIKYHSLVVYKNEQQEHNYFMADTDLLIFTSPLNAEAYLKRHYIQPHQKIVAIGESTAATLRRLGWFEIIVSAQPSENALAKCVIDLLEK
jgi:uroporphyrinogen-III synthase